MKTIFKVGDKVFDHQFGWGKVISIDSYNNLIVGFGELYLLYSLNGCRPNSSNPTLSFTEYTLEGFSQHIDYNDYVGKWGKFWDNGNEYRSISKLDYFDGKIFKTENRLWYHNFKPLTDEQIKILEL